jgi:hypothetical protein
VVEEDEEKYKDKIKLDEELTKVIGYREKKERGTSTHEATIGFC